jgi:hypothetical protein
MATGGTTSAATPLQPQPMRPQQKGGRLYLPDARDRNYELTPKRLTALQKALGVTKRRKLPWHIGEILDQGNTSECVAHAYMAFVEAAPIVHKSLGWTRAQRTELYDAARQIDGFPMPHDGTTARAVLTIARSRGWIAEYLWVNDEDTAKEYLATRGPLMVGTDWFQGMFTTDKHGYVEPSGDVAGGHEYVERWYYPPSHKKYPDTFEYVNSWSEEFGDGGLFRMKADVRRYIVQQLNGDVVLPSEVAVVRKALKAA